MKPHSIILMLAFLSGCAADLIKGYQEITKDDAMRIAKHEFERVNPGQMVHFNITIKDIPGENVWSIWFNGTGSWAVPGGYFWVRVNKLTGKAEVMPSD